MGQKVNPHGLRVGVIKDWDSRWYSGGDTYGTCWAVPYGAILTEFQKCLIELAAQDAGQ